MLRHIIGNYDTMLRHIIGTLREKRSLEDSFEELKTVVLNKKI